MFYSTFIESFILFCVLLQFFFPVCWCFYKLQCVWPFRATVEIILIMGNWREETLINDLQNFPKKHQDYKKLCLKSVTEIVRPWMSLVLLTRSFSLPPSPSADFSEIRGVCLGYDWLPYSLTSSWILILISLRSTENSEKKTADFLSVLHAWLWAGSGLNFFYYCSNTSIHMRWKLHLGPI